MVVDEQGKLKRERTYGSAIVIKVQLLGPVLLREAASL